MIKLEELPKNKKDKYVYTMLLSEDGLKIEFYPKTQKDIESIKALQWDKVEFKRI